jgi:acyl-CoA hydrolase
VPRLFARTCLPDVVLLHVAPPRKGKVSLGIEVNVLPAAVEQARANGGVVIAQINPDMPWTYGDSELDADLVDLAIEAQEPLAQPVRRPPGEVEAAIGERVAGLVADRSTLQLGIGGVPDATLAALTGRRSLRIWSEMVSDGILDLTAAGALDPDVAARGLVPVRVGPSSTRGRTTTRACRCCAPRRRTTPAASPSSR